MAEARIAALGLSDKITVHLLDYRKVVEKKEWEGAFDAFVCIEMVEVCSIPKLGPPA